MPRVFSQEEIEKNIDDAMSRYPDRTGQVLNVLNEIQMHFGYVPDFALSTLSKRTGLPMEQLQDVRTFFNDLTSVPVGDHVVMVCDGTACHTCGSLDLLKAFETALKIKEGETTPDGSFTLKTVHCLGACGLAPLVSIDGVMYGHVKLASVVNLLKSVRQ